MRITIDSGHRNNINDFGAVGPNGEKESASDRLYNRLSSYNPQLNDRIVVDVDEGKYLILGKVVK